MSKVYIVRGMTGEYSDSREWSVLAYRHEGDANAHVERAEAWLREHGLAMSGGSFHRLSEVPKNPHDAAMSVDYTGTRYYVESVDLAEEQA